MGHARRYRIRPPGCTDTARYSWKTYRDDAAVEAATAAVVNGGGGGGGVPDVAAGAAAAAEAESVSEKIVCEIEGVYEEVKTVQYKKHSVKVEGKQCSPSGLMMHRTTVEWPAASGSADDTPLVYALRWAVPAWRQSELSSVTAPTDTAPKTFVRKVKYPSLVEEREYHLEREIVSHSDSEAVVVVRTPEAAPSPPQELKGLFLYHHVAVKREGDTMRATVHEAHHFGGAIPMRQINGHSVNIFALMVLRLTGVAKPEVAQDNLLLGDIARTPEVCEVAEGLLQEFNTACDAEDGFVLFKDVHIKKLNRSVKLYRKKVDGTNYDMFRIEAEIDCPSVESVVSIIEHIPLQGPCKKLLTPECEEQGVHLDEATQRIAFKIDKLGPWPMQRREYLLLSILGWRADGTMLFCQRSIKDKRYPPTSGNCLAHFHNVGFRARPSTTPGKVHFMQLLHADPIKLMTSLVDTAMADKAQNVGSFQELAGTRDKWVRIANGVPVKN